MLNESPRHLRPTRMRLPWFGWFGNGSPRRDALLLALGAGVITWCFFAPRFWVWRALGVPLGELIAVQPELNRAWFALQQLGDPWMRVDDSTNRVIEWRLLVPIVGHYLHLPHWLYLALPYAGCMLALAAIASVVWDATRDTTAAFGAALVTATASWFFVSTGWLAYFDSWLIVALVLASFARRRGVLFVVALLAPWVDERFILALPICVVVRAGGRDGAGQERGVWWRDLLVLLVGLAPYVAVRLGAEVMQVRATSRSYWSERPLLPAPVGATLWGIWSGLRLGWLACAISFLAFAGRARWLAVAVVGVTLLVNLGVADDLSRSMSVAVPLVLAGVIRLWRLEPERSSRLLLGLCAGNLLLPAHHVIASPGNVEEAWHLVPILSLPAEIAHSNGPPYFASPFAYNRRGMDAFQAGDAAKARIAFDLALRFSPDFSRARTNRGIVSFLAGQREEGMAELDAALTRSPGLHEARMQRAAFRQQLGDLRGALADVQEALRHMPADWPKRKDAEALERRLAGRSEP